MNENENKKESKINSDSEISSEKEINSENEISSEKEINSESELNSKKEINIENKNETINEEVKDLSEEETNNEPENKNDNVNYKTESTPEQEKKPSKLKGFFNTIVFLFGSLIWIACILLVLFIVLSVSSKRTDLFGYRLYIIMSGSMEPTINVQDVIVTQETDDLKEGDIIAFENSNMITVHRIVKVYTEGEKQMFQTKGDNNNTTDQGLVQKTQVKGKVKYKIPFVGKAIIYLQSHFIILIFAIGILIIIVLVRRLI